MSVDLQPEIIVTAGFIPLEDDFQVSPGFILHAPGKEFHDDSGSWIDGGRLTDGSQDIESTLTPKLTDTYIVGTPSRTGRAFSSIAGTWDSNWLSPWSNKYGILMNDGRDGQTFEIRDNATTSNGIQHALARIRRGVAPTGSPHTKADNYAYLELNYADAGSGYRLALEWGQPIRLEYRNSNIEAGAWKPVAVARELGNLEHYLAQNNGDIWLRINPDTTRGTLTVEVGTGHYLRHSPERGATPGNPNAPALLPTYEQFRLSGKNGWLSFETYAGRFQTLTLKKAPRYIGRTLPNADQAIAIINQLGGGEAGQTDTLNVDQDGAGNLSWEVTGSQEDAGDSLGGTKPVRYSDVTIYIPSIWAGALFTQYLPEANPRCLRVMETQVWDDENRIGRTFGHVILQNADGRYNGLRGNYALNLVGGNGYQTGQRCRGVMGFGPDGIEEAHFGPEGTTTIPFADFFVKMERQLEQELVLDGLSLPTAIRLVCDIGQISPKFLQSLPPLVLPPYSDFYPDFILAKGTGIMPKRRYLPTDTALGVLIGLLRDAGEPLPGRFGSAPYYAFFDPYGNFRVEYYDPARMQIARSFFTVDPSGAGQLIDEPLVINNSTDQLRTHVTIQGQDSYTYELLMWHMELPWNFGLVGWRKGLMERDARYGSPEYMSRAGMTAVIQSSLGTQLVRFKAPFDPNFRAGQIFSLTDPEMGTGLYNALRLTSVYGYDNKGGADCYSWVTGRSLISSVVF